MTLTRNWGAAMLALALLTCGCGGAAANVLLIGSGSANPRRIRALDASCHGGRPPV